MENSSLAELASLASSSLAINLTYLILDRFKYRESIRDHARRALELLRDESSSVEKTTRIRGFTKAYGSWLCCPSHRRISISGK